MADNASLQVVGAEFARIIRAGGVNTSQMIYITRGISELFLSTSACVELGLVSSDIPKVHKKVWFTNSPPLTFPRVGHLGKASATSGKSYDEGSHTITDSKSPTCTAETVEVCG